VERADVAARRFTGIIAAVVAVGAVVASLGLPLAIRPAEADAATPSRFVPWDMITLALEECMDVIPETERYITIFPLDWNVAPGGQLRMFVGKVDLVEPEPGVYVRGDDPVVDMEASSLVSTCLDARRYEQEPVFREPTPAERLVLHDWVRRVQEPCLAARGVPFESPDDATLMNPRERAWSMPEMTGADFETRLAIRRACPPIPKWLHDDGVLGG